MKGQRKQNGGKPTMDALTYRRGQSQQCLDKSDGLRPGGMDSPRQLTSTVSSNSRLNLYPAMGAHPRRTNNGMTVAERPSSEPARPAQSRPRTQAQCRVTEYFSTR